MRGRTVIVLATAGTLLAGCGGNTASTAPAVKATTTPTDLTAPPPTPSPASPRPLAGGVITLRIDADAKQILDYAGFKLSAVGAADGRGHELWFPVRGGKLAVTPPAGRIDLEGVLRISRGDKHVDATDLRIDAAQEVVTALVEGRRVPLLRFRLAYPRELPPAGSPFTAHGTVSIVGDRVVEQLGRTAEVAVLREGLPLGTMRIAAW